ncbi:MAG: TIGR01777 family oxidoreductase [Desulfobacterales bacterium]|nr:TIGR01777 family oxidoreductase [Desulfobacterales bacterium]
MKTKIFIKQSHIDVSARELFQWHARPGALERLSPPWDPVKVLHREGGIQKGAKVALKMKAGPVSFTWKAEHLDYDENRMFRDRQARGPFRKWIHTHTFIPDGENACYLKDAIEYALPVPPFGSLLGNRFVEKRLEHIFVYRHETTRLDMAAHQAIAPFKPLTFLISGASGVIGCAIIPFLTTGGHRVISLVRKKPVQENEVFWDPSNGIIEKEHLPQIDVFIHLAGEHIGQGKWTSEKKKIIIESRTKGTSLLAKTAAEMTIPPKVFLSASAIGFYGHRDNRELTETDGPGDDFISSVCNQWENAARPAMEKNIRTVFLRIGVALTPSGGALQRLLLPFSMGMGGRIGTGKQFMSWVGIDDVIGSIYHIIHNDRLTGPVNIVSPNPATNYEITAILSQILKRPAFMHIPEKAIKLFFGEMGKEVLLSSTRVYPEKLIETGYKFRYPDLYSALSHVLGAKKEYYE